jgi:hypothetical protein
MSFFAITIYVASQRVFVVVYFVMTQSGTFWIHPHSSTDEYHGRNAFLDGLKLDIPTLTYKSRKQGYSVLLQ